MREQLLLLSGYGEPGQADMAVCRLLTDGTLQSEYTMEHGRAPSFCCRGKNGWIYAASERQTGADITAYVLEHGALRETAFLEIPEGRGLCHLYACGSVIYGSCFENGLFFAVDAELSRVLWRYHPKGGHAHWTQAANGNLFLVDLGNDCLYRFPMHNDLPVGEAVILSQPRGSGPRQVLDAADGNLECVYELDGCIRMLNMDGKTLFEAKASSLDSVNYPGGACFAADGTLFVSNRGPNTISAWQRDGQIRRLRSEWPTGNWPRTLTAVPETSFLLAACQREGAVHCYSYADCSCTPVETASVALPGASCILPLGDA